MGKTLSRPIVNPMTGEIMAEAGETLSKAKALEIEKAGVDTVYVDVNGREVKVISNGMVDAKDFVSFDPEEVGINEKVRFSVLREILENSKDENEIKEAFKERVDELIPKHIIVDDIFASINYLNCLASDIGTIDDIDHLGNRRVRRDRKSVV